MPAMRKVLIIGVSLLVTYFAWSAQARTMKEHLVAVHKVRCEKLMEADCPLDPKPASAEACVSDVEAGITAGGSGLDRQVSDVASEACVQALKQVDASACKTVQKKMSQPPCDMRTLLGLPAPPTPPHP